MLESTIEKEWEDYLIISFWLKLQRLSFSYFVVVKGGKVLARYEQSAREFLYPTPTLTGKDGVERELLLGRTVHFTVS